jgi:hypothetical protein
MSARRQRQIVSLHAIALGNQRDLANTFWTALCIALSQKETPLVHFDDLIPAVKKDHGEQTWKLANFVRNPKLLITKVPPSECPGVP